MMLLCRAAGARAADADADGARPAAGEPVYCGLV